MYALYGYILFDEVIRVPLSLTSISLNSECRNRLHGATCEVLSIAVPSALRSCTLITNCVCDRSIYDMPAPLMSNSIGIESEIALTGLNSAHELDSTEVCVIGVENKSNCELLQSWLP